VIGIHAAVEQHLLRGLDHLPRPAEEPLVDGVGTHQLIEEPVHPISVDMPVKELDLLLLAREHVIQSQPFRELVLEVLELLEKHDVLDRPVAVDERGRAPRSTARMVLRLDRMGAIPLPAAIIAYEIACSDPAAC